MQDEHRQNTENANLPPEPQHWYSDQEEGPYYVDNMHGAIECAADSMLAQVGDTVTIWRGEGRKPDLKQYAGTDFERITELLCDDDFCLDNTYYREPPRAELDQLDAEIAEAVAAVLSKHRYFADLVKITSVTPITVRITSVEPLEWEELSNAHPAP